MTKKESIEMNILIPVHLSYVQAGISKPNCYNSVPRLLWEFGNAKSKDDRLSKMQELISLTSRIVENHESELHDTLSSTQERLNQIEDQREKVLLENKLGQIRNAIALSVRLRVRHNLSATCSQMDKAQASNNDSDMPTICTNVNPESSKGSISSENELCPIERSQEKGFVPEKNQEWLQTKQTTVARSRQEKLADLKRECRTTRFEQALTCVIVKRFQSSKHISPAALDAVETESRRTNFGTKTSDGKGTQQTQRAVLKHRPQRPAPVAIPNGRYRRPVELANPTSSETEKFPSPGPETEEVVADVRPYQGQAEVNSTNTGEGKKNRTL